MFGKRCAAVVLLTLCAFFSGCGSGEEKIVQTIIGRWVLATAGEYGGIQAPVPNQLTYSNGLTYWFYKPTFVFSVDGTYSATYPKDNRGPVWKETGTYTLSDSALTINGLRVGVDSNDDGIVEESDMQDNIYSWPATTVTFVGEGMLWVFTANEGTHQWGFVRS